MSTYQEYNDIFEREIIQQSKGVIFSFPPFDILQRLVITALRNLDYKKVLWRY